jgi:drug/metabolite transporter (DMT)-like permease
MSLKKSTSLLAWIILLFLVIIWGSSFFLMKRGLMYFSALEVGMIRLSLSFIILLPFVFSRLKKFSLKQHVLFFLTGIIGNAIPYTLYPFAEKGLDSGPTGVLNSLTTIFALIIGLAFFKIKIKWINVLGVFLGLIGAIGLLSVSGGNTFNFNLKYGLLVVLATIMYAININMIKFFLKEIDSFTIAVMAFFYVGFFTISILFLFTDFYQQLLHDPRIWDGLIYLGILSLFGTVIALIVFNYLIKITSVIFSASVTYLMPIVALLWGVWDGEKFEWYFLFWISLIIGGVLLVNTKKPIR